jgi:hypothetical protein
LQLRPKYRFKHLGASLLFVALAWCSMGIIAWNAARVVSYHYAARQRQKAASCDTIIIPGDVFKTNSILQWIEPDEIRYKGKMFDIKTRQQLADGNTMLTGHFDELDDNLFQTLATLFGKEGHPSQNNKHGLFWFCEAVMPLAPIKQNTFFPEKKSIFPFYGHLPIITYHPDIPYPPPNACV